MAPCVTGIRLSGYGVAYFFAAGAFMSFWPVWLRDRGISDAEIGTLFMSRQLVGIGAMLAIGWIAHRIGNVRGVILVLAGSATILLTGYQFATTFFAILAVTLLWGGVWAPTAGALRRHPGQRDAGARHRLRPAAGVGLGGLHPRHGGVRRRGRSQRAGLDPLCQLRGIVLLVPLALWLPADARTRTAQGGTRRSASPISCAAALPAVHAGRPAAARRATPCSTASAR